MNPTENFGKCLIVLGLIFSSTADAGDWPQILGPKRNGTATDEKLAAWPAAGPKKMWSREIGSGYAGPIVADNRVILFHRVADKERVEALDAKTGRQLWKTDFTANYRGGVNSDTGPRCVPLLHGNSVYVFGAAGDLHALDARDGKPRWSRDLYREFSGLEGYFGAGSTPVVVGDRLLVNVGGRDDAGIAAFSLADGKTIWKATDERASYSSPTIARIGDKTVALFVTRLNAMAIDPTDGTIALQFPFGARGPTVNAAAPLVFDKYLFVTASYRVGGKLVDLSHGTARTVWANDTSLSSQYNTPVHADGYLYGIHGREDIGLASLRCVDAKTGKIAWTKDSFGVAHIILADGKLLILTVNGQLTLAAADSSKFKPLATATVSDNTTRALPALADGCFYFRDNQGTGGTLHALKLSP